jgi:ATP-binding cassette subfamily A (ABC1) protein 3
LDEADFLSDNLAVLAAPGKLIAEGSPVTLKRNLGAGYSVRVNFTSTSDSTSPSDQDLTAPATGLLQRISTIAPDTKLSMSAQNASYHLNSKDSVTVERVLQLLGSERSELGISSYDVYGSSIEDIFLDLMHQSEQSQDVENDSHSRSSSVPPQTTTLEMGNGRPRTPLGQALTIFHKRALIARRSWLSPLLTVAIATAASCLPLTFIKHRVQTCTHKFGEADLLPLYLPGTGGSNLDLGVVVSPPGSLSTLDDAGRSFQVDYVADNTTFVSTIDENYTTLNFGGVSLDLSTGNSLVAWNADPPGFDGAVMLNLATNILFSHALNVSGSNLVIIDAKLGSFPYPNGGTLIALKWVAFFGLAMVSRRTTYQALS